MTEQTLEGVAADRDRFRETLVLAVRDLEGFRAHVAANAEHSHFTQGFNRKPTREDEYLKGFDEKLRKYREVLSQN